LGIRIEAVIFDIGDVLEVNPRTGWPERWARRVDMDLDAFDGCLEQLWAPGSVGRSSLEEIEQQTAAALGLDEAALNALMEDAWLEYVGSLNQELADYFASLRPGYRTGIVSNSFVGAREREQAVHGFEDMCDVIVYSHEEGCLKPDPRIYRIVCDRLGVDPVAAVLLDDLQANVDGARALGMQGITFADTAQAIAELQALLTG
jgi:putative hydrolase of the HAD superfamily